MLQIHPGERWLCQCMNRNLKVTESVYEHKFEWWLSQCMNINLNGDWVSVCWMVKGQCMNWNSNGDWVSVWTEIWLVTESRHEQKFEWWLSQCMLNGEESVYEQKFEWWLSQCMNRNLNGNQVSQCMLTGDWVSVWTEIWMATESVYVEWWRVSVWTEIRWQ